MTNARNGCVPAKLDFKPGVIVQVMPRAAAMIVSRKHGTALPAYSDSLNTRLTTNGHLAVVVRVDREDSLVVRVLGSSSLTYRLSKTAIFGVAHQPLDVVEVGLQSSPDQPPMRRCFIGYSFDHEFSPVVLTYDEDDTTSILEDANSASVDLECSEIWQFCYPKRDETVVQPEIAVTVSVNGRSVSPSAVSAETWANLRRS